MKFWKRQATLQIGSKRFGMDDLYFKFTVPFEDSEKLGTATIEAYNLSPATRNSIKKGMPIILNAGYEGDIGAIFTGKVSQVSDKHSGTEVITTIAAAEALEEWLSKEVNKTYTAGSKASAIVKDLLNIFGLEVGTMELAVDKEYPRGKVCKGKVKNVLTEIVTSDCKSRFLIRNGIVTINDPKTGTKTGYVLSAESGLLQAAEATDRTETTTRQTTVKDGKEKQEVTYKRECLLNYHLAPADVVKIKSDTLNGNHLIKGGQHTGCPDGDWKTTIEVQPLSKALDAGVYRTQPQILSVPVALVRGGGFVLRPCYKSGDVGVLLYIDHDIDRIAASGEESEPNTERNHSDEDAVFIGAFVPASNPLSGLPDNCLVMATEGGGIYVAVKQDKVEIKGDVEVQGKVKVRDDVIAKTISLVNHKHTDSRNGNTSAPLP